VLEQNRVQIGMQRHMKLQNADLIMKKRYSYQELISSVIPKEFSFPGGKVSIVLFSMILH